MQYFDDLHIGDVRESEETFTFTKDGIMGFASEWDPMPLHLDEELAKQSPIGDLFASSIHTIAAAIKLTYTVLEEEVAVLAGLGWTDVNFPIPIKVGDSIRIRSELIEKRESKSKPDRGIITTHTKILNQRGEMAAEYKIKTMVMRKV